VDAIDVYQHHTIGIREGIVEAVDFARAAGNDFHPTHQIIALII
jgi:hypothetical protein